MSTLLTLLAIVAMCIALTACFADAAAQSTDAKHVRVYLGTVTRNDSRGIYRAQLDLQSGKLSEPTLAIEAASPGFMTLHPNGKWMYSVGQHVQDDGTKTGGVYAFAVDQASGELTWLNAQPSGGGGPCHLTVDPSGRCVLVAHYGSGSVSVLPIESDGRVGAPTSVVQHKPQGSGARPDRQKGPHAHSIKVHSPGRYAFAADLGTDELVVYRFDNKAGTLEAVEGGALATAPGAGPRHQAFHPTLDVLYLINELDSTVMALRFDVQRERFEVLQTITTLPAGVDLENYPSEVAVHPNGRFLYGANRGHDSLAVFQIDQSTGKLTASGHVPIEGAFPRHFAIDPTGQYLIAAHQKSNDLSVFELDAETGEPKFTGQRIALDTPMCVLYMPIR